MATAIPATIDRRPTGNREELMCVVSPLLRTEIRPARTAATFAQGRDRSIGQLAYIRRITMRRRADRQEATIELLERRLRKAEQWLSQSPPRRATPRG